MPATTDDRLIGYIVVVVDCLLLFFGCYNVLIRLILFQSSNLLSATLCLVKELDYPSLEVVEHAVRCRIDELATE